MKWRKMGLIYGPDGRLSWAKHSALTPTPILLNEEVIRIYAGFRDEKGISRIGYVDVDGNNPSRLITVSKEPVLDIGLPGTFDDNGMILGDIVKFTDRWHMFYIGFQLVEKVKFLAFTGLAVSIDGGNSFSRSGRVPILDRSEEGLYCRAIHSVLLEDGMWKVWYATGSEWTWIQGQPYPNYHIRYIDSKDGITFPDQGKICIDHQENEYRIGRPKVYRHAGIYKMFYTIGTLQRDYISGYAESKDGINWKRMDETIGMHLSDSGWDSKMLCYPSVFQYKDRTYMFYNGNNYGEAGFGYAVLEEW
jgi:hypothetical protein